MQRFNAPVVITDYNGWRFREIVNEALLPPLWAEAGAQSPESGMWGRLAGRTTQRVGGVRVPPSTAAKPL